MAGVELYFGRVCEFNNDEKQYVYFIYPFANYTYFKWDHVVITVNIFLFWFSIESEKLKTSPSNVLQIDVLNYHSIFYHLLLVLLLIIALIVIVILLHFRMII